jgi:DNA polymerase I-like protein with 3'-5' exonuclease and polymerase domains
MGLREAAAREAINTDNQGLASHIGLIGCFLLDQLHPYIEQVAFNHDAGLALVDDILVDKAQRDITQIFEKEVREYILKNLHVDFDVPIKIDIKVSQAWGES